MANIVLTGDTSGAITVAAPAVAGTNTITLPATTSTIATTTDITGPAFSAYATSGQNITTGTVTKVVYDSEDFDTNTNFASNRFTPTVAGYYQINTALFCAGGSGGAAIYVYKNGALYFTLDRSALSGSFNVYLNGGCLVQCNGSSDYLEIYVFQNSGGTLSFGNGSKDGCWFNGFLARKA